MARKKERKKGEWMNESSEEKKREMWNSETKIMTRKKESKKGRE